MRDIRFRVWDGKRMHYGAVVEFLDEYTSGDKAGTVVFSSALDSDYEGCEPNEKLGQAVMQYTGLLDKNGKDVYEGDIVRFENADGNHDCETIYEPPRFVFKRKDGAYLQPALFNGIELINIASQQLEVIGNIYENLELLK